MAIRQRGEGSSAEARRLADTPFGSEDELILKVVVPFCGLLGYTPEQIAIKFPVRAYRPGRSGRKPEADCLLFAGSGRSLDSSLVVIEAKRDDQESPEDQARFYSANLFVPFYVAWYGHQFDVYQLHAFKPPHTIGSFSLAGMTDELLAQLRSTLSPEAVQGYCEAHEIKTFDLREESREAEGRYVTACLEKLRMYRMLDLARPLDLLRTYVPAFIRPLEPRALPSDATQDAVRQGLHPSAIEDQFGKPGNPVSLLTELTKVKTLALIGDPGSGKTTLLKHLCVELCQAATTRLPFFVSVQQLVATGKTIHDTMRHHLALSGSEQYADPILLAALKEGRAAICVDGMDELHIEEPASARRALAHMSAEIEELRATNPENLIVATCRRESWATCRARLTFVTHDYEVLPLPVPSVRAFVNHWFGADDADGASALLGVFRRTGWPEFSTNPLLLGLTCIVFEKRRRVPERRSVLYRRCLDVLLEEWDATRRISRAGTSPFISSEQMLDLLEDVALHFHRERRACFTREEVLQRISSSLGDLGLSAGECLGVFTDLTTQRGLLRSWSIEGLWAFPHLCFQEYLAARGLRNNAVAIPELILHKDDPYWHEVIAMYAEEGDAGGLLRSLLDTTDNILRTNLFLAANCVSRGIKLNNSPRF